MQLSYSLRLICLVLCSGGLLQLLMELLAWTAGPLLLSQAAGQSARRAERLLFLLALFARCGPWAIVASAWLPAYIHGEDNFSVERVGFVCLAGAAVIAARVLWDSVRIACAWFSTHRRYRFCNEVGRSPGGLPLVLYASEHSLLAVAGVFRSRVIVSQSLLTSGRMPAAALEIALRHEDAHARQRDNLKLLMLSLLPHFPLATHSRRSLCRQWRLAAEMAADEDSAMGRSERSILLAELLVTLARSTKERTPYGALAFLSPAQDLRVRVDRLLQNSTAPARNSHGGGAHSRTNRITFLAFALGLGALALVSYACVHTGHRSAEVLLHLG